MNNDTIINASRRVFLKAGAGLTLAVYAPLSFAADTGGPGKAGAAAASDASFEPNAFVRIGTDDSVTVISKHLEMGQGTYTGLATLVAEELDAAWPQIRVEGAPADAKRYNNLAWGPAQGTGGSSAILNCFEQMRKAGAIARAMLVAAAADRWKVTPDTITVSHGLVTHKASKRSARFGELAKAASTMPVPDKVTLKKPADYIYIGKKAPRVDSKAKTTGTAIFTQDVKLPGMLTAVVAHPPRFGGKVRNFDATKTKAVKGVTDVVAIPTGVAVLAKDFWSARKGRDALLVEWDDTNAFRQSSADITAQYTELAATEGTIATTVGTPGAAGANHKVEATFHFPFLAHAAMEPLNCVVKLDKDSCEVWNGEQFQTSDQYALATVLGLKPEQVKLNMLFAGGSFGRRANPQSDYLVEAALIAKAINGRTPVKLVWTREDDMRGGNYRPAYLHRIIAGLDAKNSLVAWEHRIVGQSILAGTAFESAMVKGGIDATSVEGASELPYAIPAMQVELHTTKLGVPVQWWRSVGATHTALSTETFIDDIAVLQGKDTVKFRSDMLDKHPRHKAVLALAAKQSGWDKPLAAGKSGERRGRGVALHRSFDTIVAQIVEVTVTRDNKLKIDRVVCALDCGIAVNPDVIRAQMEGGIGFGLSAALYGEITLKDGMVEQSNFNDYPVLRIADMPKIEVHIVDSTEPPTGVGEPGVPVIAPALSNAIFAATGKRLRDLPLKLV
jgi:isoquinoline 1-oxidoreductase beta subunit